MNSCVYCLYIVEAIHNELSGENNNFNDEKPYIMHVSTTFYMQICYQCYPTIQYYSTLMYKNFKYLLVVMNPSCLQTTLASL